MQIRAAIFHLSQPAVSHQCGVLIRPRQLAVGAIRTSITLHPSRKVHAAGFALISRCRELHPAAAISRKCSPSRHFFAIPCACGVKSIAAGVPHPSLAEFTELCCWSGMKIASHALNPPCQTDYCESENNFATLL
jgi:hypothetical protein